MSLLSSVIGGLMGGSGNSSPMGGVLMNLLGGGGQGGMGSSMGGGMGGGLGGMASQLLGGQSGGGGFGGGGLGGLMSQFQQGGMGHIMDSWVGNGPNQPVSPQQLQGVFGQEQIQNMASQAGMQPQDFLSQLSQHLPDAVHGMTPDGRLPDEGTTSV